MQLTEIHPGARIAIARLTMDELGVARAMATGELTSPQRYGNVSLFDMRITGTGVAYRNEKRDEAGNIVQKEEFVYRRPENYLTPEFIARCNGLQVIMLHPKTAILTSQEFGARTVGSMMLPYIKGDEVWGIAKIYDDDAIRMLEAGPMSTSPAVLLGNGDQKLKLEDGSDLLIEGKPSLLDHLAICEHGVWDKGGEPSGVRSDNQGAKTMTEEEKAKQLAEEAAAKKKADEEAAAKAAADASAGTVPDKLLKALDAFGERMDAFGKRIDAHTKRMDDDDAKRKADDDARRKADDDAKKRQDDDDAKRRADAFAHFSHRKDDDDDDSYRRRHDEEEERCKSDAMAAGDPEEVAADKAKRRRKDAEELEEEERAVAADKRKKDDDDKAKKDAAFAAAAPELAKRLAEMEKQMPKQLTDADRHAFAQAQARADEVYGAFGKRAPYPLNGEDVLAYRKRLIGGLKSHSEAWAPVDVLSIADEATFRVAESAVLKDAMQAALHPVDLRDDELREIARVDQATGVRTIEFRGKRSFIAGLKRPPRYVTRIGLRREA